MRIFASLRIAGRALRRNKMRSLLTMLGIIIGVGAVIGSVSLTTGATKQVEDQVASLGENVITVFSGNFTSGGDARRLGQRSDPDLGRRKGDRPNCPMCLPSAPKFAIAHKFSPTA